MVKWFAVFIYTFQKYNNVFGFVYECVRFTVCVCVRLTMCAPMNGKNHNDFSLMIYNLTGEETDMWEWHCH